MLTTIVTTHSIKSSWPRLLNFYFALLIIITTLQHSNFFCYLLVGRACCCCRTPRPPGGKLVMSTTTWTTSQYINKPVFSQHVHASIINCIDGCGGLDIGGGAPDRHCRQRRMCAPMGFSGKRCVLSCLDKTTRSYIVTKLNKY
jgi:hypothetical protein